MTVPGQNSEMSCSCIFGGIDFVSFYDFSIGEVMYCICVIGDIGFASISMILELFRQCDIVFVFHLISITSTWVIKDIGG